VLSVLLAPSLGSQAYFETIDTIVTDAIGAEDLARLEESGIDVPVAG
jgi:hypothetical protein